MCRKLIHLASLLFVISLAWAGGAQAADPNLVGWWPLNEGAGDTVTDLSASGTTGTINNPAGGLGVDGAVWIEDAERGMVLSFNGANSTGACVTTGVTIPAMDLTTDFTWMFWCKQDPSQGFTSSTGGNDVILGNRYGGTTSPLQFVKFTPTNFEYYNGDNTSFINYPDIPGGVWVHNVTVKKGATLTYYRDGFEVLSIMLTNPQTMGANPFYMGADGYSGVQEAWCGCLSDVRIYNKAATQLEVLAAMAGVERIDMEIGSVVKPPVIDGEVDYVWGSASTQSFVPLEDPADASGTWKVLYDAENFYVLLDVTDDSLQNDSASSWQDDSVEVYFDGGNTKDGPPLSGDNHQYTFGWTTADIQGTNIAGATEGMEHAQVTTPTGWRIEIKMPWLSMQDTMPQARDLIGIDCYYNDDDDGGDSREGKMLTFSTVEGWNDASQWGTAILAIIPEPVDPGADGLVAYYALENNTDDSSGNNLHGTIVGNPTFVEGPAGYGTAMEFDGESYVDCGFDPRLNITGPISMSIWIRPGTDGSIETAPLCKADSVRGWSWQLRYGWNTDKPTIMGFQFNATGGGVWVYVNQELSVGEWYHIAASHDGATVKCYLDGVETDSAPMPSIVGGPSSLLIGSDGWRSDWIGAIDEVAIYNRGLSDEEVLYLAGFRENLVLNPSFEEDEAVLDDPDWAHWCTWNPAEGAGSNSTIVDTEAIHGTRSLRIEPKGIENWHFIVLYLPILVDMDKDYDVSFWAKAEAPRPLTVQLKAADNSINAWGATDFQLTTDWAEYHYTSEVLIDDVKLEILCSGTEVPFWLDLVSVCEGD
jgi:hypothetical protein